MKKVQFIKDHFSGLKKGDEREFAVDHAQKLVNEGYAKADGLKKEATEEVSEEAPEKTSEKKAESKNA